LNPVIPVPNSQMVMLMMGNARQLSCLFKSILGECSTVVSFSLVAMKSDYTSNFLMSITYANAYDYYAGVHEGYDVHVADR
jgi:hypothetical protein